jgi:uncharacterized protein YndB with AHSA1/START domain/uncharacterized protein YciI
MTTRKTSRAIADVGAGIVLARIEIAAPPERVFRAISTEELATWWGSDTEYRTTKHTVDLRPGGAYRSDGIGRDGTPFHVSGTIVEVEPPKRLVQTWEPSWQPGAPTTVTWTLEPIPEGTRVTVRHSGFTDPASCDGHAMGWERVTSWLAAHVAPETPAHYFMMRLLPPRPTFMQDMTADERAIMMAHSQYWRGLLAEGKVVAFGPVGGAHGGFGLGLVQAADEAALAVLQAADPAIQANVGLRYENAPMVALVF